MFRRIFKSEQERTKGRLIEKGRKDNLESAMKNAEVVITNSLIGTDWLQSGDFCNCVPKSEWIIAHYMATSPLAREDGKTTMIRLKKRVVERLLSIADMYPKMEKDILHLAREIRKSLPILSRFR